MMVLRDNGVAIGLVYLLTTITFGLLELRNVRSRESQERLIENQKLLESAQQIGQFGFCILDSKTSAIRLSSYLLNMFSKVATQPEFTIEQFATHYVRVSDQKRLKAFISQVLQVHVPDPIEFQISCDVGTEKSIWIHLVGWENQNDRKCAVLIFQDVSDKSSLFEQMSHTSRLATLGETATSIGHQIINPLTAARLAVESLEKSLRTGSGSQDRNLDLVRRIDHRLEAITSLVNSISQFARAESAFKQPVSLHDTIYQAVDFFKEIVPSQAPRIDLDCLAENDSVRGYDIHFQQVLLNLLNNAMHATRNSPDPVIKISTQNDGGNLVVSVSDNGTGIPPEIREKLFTPFFTTKERGTGTGLGLSIADAIVKDAGGRIAVDSELGHGSAFRLQLPVLQN
jgi:signal transduction histidine kinase